jgi:hypothetical protein
VLLVCFRKYPNHHKVLETIYTIIDKANLFTKKPITVPGFTFRQAKDVLVIVFGFIHKDYLRFFQDTWYILNFYIVMANFKRMLFECYGFRLDLLGLIKKKKTRTTDAKSNNFYKLLLEG